MITHTNSDARLKAVSFPQHLHEFGISYPGGSFLTLLVISATQNPFPKPGPSVDLDRDNLFSTALEALDHIVTDCLKIISFPALPAFY
jgi:hypothetical protein